MSLTSYRAAPPRAKPARRSRDHAPGSKPHPRPRNVGQIKQEEFLVLGRPGNDLLSQVLRHSTIGARAFDGRVRDGIGSGHSAKATRPAKNKKEANWIFCRTHVASQYGHRLMRAIKPIELLVPVSYTSYDAYTPGLSTWSSSTALKGELVLRWVSRLDAFSGYPVRS